MQEARGECELQGKIKSMQYSHRCLLKEKGIVRKKVYTYSGLHGIKVGSSSLHRYMYKVLANILNT